MKLAFFLAAVGLSACLAWDKPVAPSSGYVCGAAEHECAIVEDDGSILREKTCCGNDEVCGGGRFNGCPDGACCVTASDGSIMGARPQHHVKP